MTDPNHLGYIQGKSSAWRDDPWGQKSLEYFHCFKSDHVHDSHGVAPLKEDSLFSLTDHSTEEISSNSPPSPLSDGMTFSETSTIDSSLSTPIRSHFSPPYLEPGRRGTLGSAGECDRGTTAAVARESFLYSSITLANPAPEIPRRVMRRILNNLPRSSCYAMRLTCKTWKRTVDQAHPLGPPAANVAPPEVLIEVFKTLSPRDFDNARRTCSQWMRVSLNRRLLESMMKRAGWWDCWQQDSRSDPTDLDHHKQSVVWRLSKRFATECLLSGRKVNVERVGFLLTAVVDFAQLLGQEVLASELVPDPISQSLYCAASGHLALRNPFSTNALIKFVASSCGEFLVVFTGSLIYTYRLGCRFESGPSSDTATHLPRNGRNTIELVSRTVCPRQVLTVTIDTTDGRCVIAALLHGRTGLLCDLSSCSDLLESQNTQGSSKYIHDLCHLDDPPKSVSICPGRSCFAFGCNSGVELHWTDEITGVDSMRFISMPQPSEILHFLNNRPGVEEEDLSLRIVSSLAARGVFGCECTQSMYGEGTAGCSIHRSLFVANSISHTAFRQTARLSYMKSTYCHHYYAKPVSDGLHLIFIEPKSGLLCVGSDAPIGGPTSLTRALICVPPFGTDLSDCWKDEVIPSVFASGSDLRWGLRIAAAYNGRIVLYSVPLDVFNVIRKERERQGDNVMGDSDLARDFFLNGDANMKRRGSLAQNQNGDWDFLLSVSYRPTFMMWPLKIYGKEIGHMENLVELSVQTTNGGLRVFAFGGNGEGRIFDIDTYTSRTQPSDGIKALSTSIGAYGQIISTSVVDRTDVQSQSSLQRIPILQASSSRKRKQPYNDLFLGPSTERLRLFNSFPMRNDFEGYPGSFFKSSSPSAFRFGVAPSMNTATVADQRRRPSFAACILDFKLPDPGGNVGR